MEKKFKILRIVAFIWKIVAWVLLVLSALGGCGALVMALTASNRILAQVGGVRIDAFSGVVIAIIALVIGVFYFISLYAVAEMIDVVLALEENTRATVEHLKNLKA